jgi:hypothetical protein
MRRLTRLLYGGAMAVMLAITVWALATRTAGSESERPAFFVATDGDDTNPGTESSPWATLQKAADSAVPGSTVFVRGGVYHQRVDINVSGSEVEGSITFRNYPGEHPVLDGAKLVVPADLSGMITVDSQRHVTIQGFEIRNYWTSEAGHNPVGILVTGEADHVRILDNHVHDMGTTFQGKSGGDAFGIAVYGTSATHAISDLVVARNEVDHLELGSSESLALNGNVDGFEVADNVVHDNNNIGIVAIGFEGTAPDPTVDQARNGSIRRNVVYNIDSFGNPAYGSDRSADGIYVDGGRDIMVETNIIHDVNIGIELASEHAGRSTRSVTARNNLVYDATAIGLAIGGYDRRRGSTEDCVIVHNTFYNSADVEWLIQFDTRNNMIANNVVYAGRDAVFIENPYAENEGNVVDHNLFYSAAGERGVWEWKGVDHGDFAAYREATGNDRHSIFADPAFIDPASGNFALEESSPAVDAGTFLLMAGALDLGGNDRAAGGIPDIGALEFPVPPPSPTPSISGPVEYVSDLEWVDASNGWGPLERDMSNGEKASGDGVTITLNGRTFDRGVGAHAPSRVRLDLEGRCESFLADVGLDDEVGNRGSVIFRVVGDGEELFTSGVVLGARDAVPIYVDVTGVETLDLVVTAGGDGNGWDHADWADARLACDA